MNFNPSEIDSQAGPLPADLSGPVIAAASRLGVFSTSQAWFEVVGSTNDVAAANAWAGCEEGRVIVADTQTAGRGRHGRTWCSPPGSGLYVSVVLRPSERATSLLTIAAGVALAEGIERASGLAPTLKWPNDLCAWPRKLGGVLAESGGRDGGPRHVVLGFGINLRSAALPADLAEKATSLEDELGRTVDRGLVLAECLAALAERYHQLQRGESSLVLRAWRVAARASLHRRIEWDVPGGVSRGIAEDVDDTGALVARTDAALERIIGGEVRWS